MKTLFFLPPSSQKPYWNLFKHFNKYLFNKSMNIQYVKCLLLLFIICQHHVLYINAFKTRLQIMKDLIFRNHKVCTTYTMIVKYQSCSVLLLPEFLSKQQIFVQTYLFIVQLSSVICSLMWNVITRPWPQTGNVCEFVGCMWENDILLIPWPCYIWALSDIWESLASTYDRIYNEGKLPLCCSADK